MMRITWKERDSVKIVVAMKQVADLQQIRLRDRKPLLDEVPLTFGRIDKNALEAAVRLKEIHDGEVIVVSAGDENLEDTIKEALAADADRALIVADNTVRDSDSVEIASILKELINRIESYELVIFGEGSGDNYSGQIGSRVAELLDLPQVGFASSIEINGKKATVVRSLEDVEEIVEIQLPAVVTVISDLNTPRIPAVSKVLKAGKKPKEVFDLSDLDVNNEKPQIKTLSNLAPIISRRGIQLKSVAELIDALKAEGAGGK